MKKFVLLVSLLLALTVAACDRDVPKPTKEESSKTTRSKTAQSSAKAKKENPLGKLTESFLKMGKVKSFRAKTTTYDAVETITTEFQAPDRFHFVSSASSDSERYRIEGTEYYKVAPDQWRKQEVSGIWKEAVWGAVDGKELKAGLDTAAKKQFIGTEVLDREPTLVFEYTIKKPTVIWTYKIWIGVSDSLPRKLDISTQPADGFSQTHPGYGSNTNYYDYDKDIKVEPPIK